MKNVIKVVLYLALLIGGAILLGSIGLKMDISAFEVRTEGVVGHPVPVCTILFPMMWVGGVLFVTAIVAIIRAIIRKLRNNMRKESI